MLQSEVSQSCLILSDPMGCSLPGFSVHGILQARILEWIAISFSRGSSWPRDWTHFSYISCIGRTKALQKSKMLTTWWSILHSREELTYRPTEAPEETTWGQIKGIQALHTPWSLSETPPLNYCYKMHQGPLGWDTLLFLNIYLFVCARS